MMVVHPDQADPNCKHNFMTCRACFQLPLYVDGIDATINNQMMKTPHDLLAHLEDLDNGIKPDIGTLNEDRGDILSEYYT